MTSKGPQPFPLGRGPQTCLSVFVRWVQGRGTTVSYRWVDETEGLSLAPGEDFWTLAREVDTQSLGAALNALRGTLPAAYEEGRHARPRDRT